MEYEGVSTFEEPDSGIVNFFKSALGTITAQAEETAVSKVVEFFRSTPLGEKVEAEATKQTLASYLKNPIVLIILLVIGYLIFKGIKR